MLEKIKDFFTNTQKKDGYVNYKTGLGSDCSRTGMTSFAPTITLNQSTLTNLYRDNGIAKRIVDILVEDSVRNFIEADQELIDELNRLKVKQNLLDVGCYGRLYGGAILVAFIDDGAEFDKPLNLNSIQRIVSFKVFDRYQVHWTAQDLSNDLYSEYFGEPEYFTITNSGNLMVSGAPSIRVHRSRCFVFGGAKLPNHQRVRNNGWDDSILQACYDALKKYDIVTSASAEMIQDFVQVIFKVKDLSFKLAQEGGWEEIQHRLRVFNQTRSVVGAGFIDADGEDYEKRSSSVAGIDALWDKYSEFICSVTGVPATKLFGKSPSGLNSTGASDMQIHYDNVRAYRADQLEPAVNWIVSMLRVQKKWLSKPQNFDWEFPSLTSPTEVEWADIKKKYAEIDAIYIDRGAIDPVECWQERFSSGSFNTNISLSKPDIENVPHEIDKDLEEILNPKEKKSESEQKLEKVIDSILERSARI